MGSPDVESLKTAFFTANLWNEWATAVVVLGVVLELVALLVFGKDMSRTEKTMLVVGSVLIVLGVGGEYIFGGRAVAAAAQLQQLSDQKVAELSGGQERDHRIATQAAAHAADLGVTVDNLQGFVTTKEKLADSKLAELKRFVAADNTRNATLIAEFRKDEVRLEMARSRALAANNVRNATVIAELERDKTDLEKARSDALAAAEGTKKDLADMSTLLNQESALRQQMIAVLTPRGLSSAQQAVLKSRLLPFAPMRVDIITFGDTREIADFGRKLAETLELAGWRPKIWSGLNGASLGVTGVPIFTHRGSPPKAGAAALALEEALIALQISAKVLGQFEGTKIPTTVSGPPWDEGDVADVRVFVGAKP